MKRSMRGWGSKDVANIGKNKPAARLSPEEGKDLFAPKKRGKKAVKWAQPKQSESQQQAECVRLEIKPLSVNAAWKGIRYKTDDYKRFEKAMLLSMPNLKLPSPPFKVFLVFGFSNSASDIDNPSKMTIDCLSKKYDFNDKLITELHIKKEVVPKGKEYIEFNILTAA